MITFIIPTLWKDDNIYSTIDSFKRIKDKDTKLLIINNTERQIESNSDKRVIIINMGFNSFVNPAWSLGVEKSTTDYVCCLNDDILIDRIENDKITFRNGSTTVTRNVGN